mmetsp:Transcript_10374/g.19088  ORF Transcript_10374/g.19088 Transcript_10374/m.19088 type:complete len:104 (+) Transcript_10374:1843-2154(+)
MRKSKNALAKPRNPSHSIKNDHPNWMADKSNLHRSSSPAIVSASQKVSRCVFPVPCHKISPLLAAETDTGAREQEKEREQASEQDYEIRNAGPSALYNLTQAS